MAEEEAGILLLQVQALRTAPMPKETMAMEEVTVCLEKTEGSLGSVEAAAVVQLATMEATEALAVLALIVSLEPNEGCYFFLAEASLPVATISTLCRTTGRRWRRSLWIYFSVSFVPGRTRRSRRIRRRRRRRRRRR